MQATVGGVPPKFHFEQAQTLPVIARALATGDFNADGRDDLAAIVSTDAYGGALTLSLYLQKPNGMLDAPVNVPIARPQTGYWTSGLTAVDLNGDGRSDLVWTQRTAPGTDILLSQPGNTWAWRRDDWSDMVTITAARAADFDGDGKLDLVSTQETPYQQYVGTVRRVVIAFGDGAGNFPRHRAEASTEDFFALGQLDGMGPPDLLSMYQAGLAFPTLRLADGSGGWSAPIALTGRGAEALRGVDVADLDSDGHLDGAFLTNTIPARLLVYPQLPGGGLAAQPRVFAGGGYSEFIAHGDLDGDGRTDLVHLDEGGPIYDAQLYFLLQDAYGLRYPAIHLFAPNDGIQVLVRGLALGDFNGDGVQDAAIATDAHGLRISHGVLDAWNGAGSLPGAPSVLDAIRDPNDNPRVALVTVAAPSNTGGNPITGYSVFPSPGGGVDLDEGTTQTVHRIAELDDNASYMFTARAITAAGMGPPSAAAGPVVFGDGGAPPTILFGDPSSREPDVSNDKVQLGVYLSKPAPAGGVHFTLVTANGTAVAGSDYVAASIPGLVIPAGETRVDVSLQIIGDFVPEPTETFHLLATSVVGGVAGTPGTYTIQDDDTDIARLAPASGILRVTEADAGTATLQVPVSLSAPQATDVVFDVRTSLLGFAVAGQDYEPLDLHDIHLPAGQVQMTVPVAIIGDLAYESSESFELEVYNVRGATGGGYTPIIIEDNEPVPTLSIGDISVVEGDQSPVRARLRVSLSAAMPNETSFSVGTVDGSASAGSDYVAAYFARVTIPPGDTGVDVDFLVKGDTNHESNETFQVVISDVQQAMPPYEGDPPAGIADGTATVTVIDNDASNSLSVHDAVVAEAPGGTTLAFTVALSEPSAQPVTFDVFTTPGTAIEGEDYLPVQQAGLVIPAGQTQLVVSVPVLDDAVVEGDETLVLNLAHANGAVVADAQGLGRIFNDDLAMLSIADASVVEGSGGGYRTMLFRVHLSSPMTVPVRFDVLAGAGTADWGADFYTRSQLGQRVIDAGRTDYAFDVLVYSDNLAESDETITATLANVEGALVGDGAAVGTIVDDDGPAAAAPIRGATSARTGRLRASASPRRGSAKR